MPEDFSPVDFGSFGRRMERIRLSGEFYQFDESAHLFEFISLFRRMLLVYFSLKELHIYDYLGNGFQEIGGDQTPRTEPCMLDVFRGRLQNDPSPELQMAYRDLGALQGSITHVRGNQLGVGFGTVMQPTMERIIRMEQKELDTLGVRVVLPPSDRQEAILDYLYYKGAQYGCNETLYSGGVVYSFAAPYSEMDFHLLCALNGIAN